MPEPDPLERALRAGMAAYAQRQGWRRVSQRRIADKLRWSDGKLRYILEGGRSGRRGEGRQKIPDVPDLEALAQLFEISFDALMDAAIKSVQAATFDSAAGTDGTYVVLAGDQNDPTRADRARDIAEGDDEETDEDDPQPQG